MQQYAHVPTSYYMYVTHENVRVIQVAIGSCFTTIKTKRQFSAAYTESQP